MAHGYATPTDLRTERNVLGDIAGALAKRVGNASNMARRERAYAENVAEKNNTSLSEAGIGRGHFFSRALGSNFGGDAIARTRGRFAKDPGMGLDPTASQASRFRGGFVDRGRYNYSEEIFSSPIEPGGALASVVGGGPSGGGVAQKLIDSGPRAIDPEIMGGEVAKYKGTSQTNAAGFTVDTTATEIKDIAGILNSIGQMMVRSSNTTVQAIDSVQKVNVKVVDSIQSLGQLQVSIAERQMANQQLLAQSAQDTSEKIADRMQASAEKDRMAQQRVSSGTETAEGSGFEGPQGGGILSQMMGGMGNLLDTGLNLLGGRGRRRGRGLGFNRMSRAGRNAQKASGFSRAFDGDPGIRGMNFRDTTMTGNTLSRARIKAGTAGKDVFNTAQNDITQRYAQRHGQKAAMKRFGGEALEKAGLSLTKGARVARFLSPVLKRVPLVGGLLDFAVNLALGESVGRSAAKAIGATLGAGLGTLVPIPGVGTILGGIAGDLLGGAVYDALSGGGASSVPSGADGMVTTGPKSGYLAQLHGTEITLSGNKSKEMKAISMNIGEGILEAQKKNKSTYAKIQASGLAQYYDKQNGWQKFLEMLGQFFPKFEFKWPWQRDGDDDGDGDNPNGRNPFRNPFRRNARYDRSTYDFGHDLPATNTLPSGAQNYGFDRGTHRHAGQDFDTNANHNAFASQLGGTVVFAGNVGGDLNGDTGYGNVVDIYNPELGRIERIAEGEKIHVRVGDTVSAGDIVMSGESKNADGSIRTGVIHYEIRKPQQDMSDLSTYEYGKHTGFSGTEDPLRFLKKHTKHNADGLPKNLEVDPVGDAVGDMLDAFKRSSINTGDEVLNASIDADSSTRALGGMPLIITTNTTNATGSGDSSSGLSLASAGSSGMGTDTITKMQHLALS